MCDDFVWDPTLEDLRNRKIGTGTFSCMLQPFLALTHPFRIIFPSSQTSCDIV